MNGSYFLKLELPYASPVFSAYISLPLAKLGNYSEAGSCASKVHNFSTRIFIVSKHTCIVFLVLCHVLTHWNVTILSQSIKTIDTQGGEKKEKVRHPTGAQTTSTSKTKPSLQNRLEISTL